MRKISEELQTLLSAALRLAKSVEADALLVMVDEPLDWQQLKKKTRGGKVLVAADTEEQLAGAEEQGLVTVVLENAATPVHDKLGQALLEAVADEDLEQRASVVAVYSGFEPGEIDSISLIDTGEHFGRLTVHDLRQLETRVPFDTLKRVVDLAVEIGREGREGKPVGTMFVVGDTRKVMESSHATSFDPVKGYARKDRSLDDARVREGVKEIAQMDGGFVVAADATLEASARYIDAPAKGITLSKGLGTRHWAAAAITRATKAVAVVVSESSGTVRVFQNGEVVLRIEPFRRPLKWKDYEYEPPAAEG